MPEHVILIVGLISGEESPYDNSYLAVYNFEDCPPSECNLYTVADKRYAKKFRDAWDAMQEWRRVDPRAPVRSDGKPNRPLTVFTISVEPA